jgi:hypothetical protein
MFYGIVIRMFVGAKEHNPPHFHAMYQGSKAVFNIQSGEMVDGSIPAKQVKLIQAWVELHKDELLADWDLAQSNDMPYAIEPLR